MALFPGPPGWAGARREPLVFMVFMVQGKINRDRHIDHPAGATPSGLSSAHLHHPPIVYSIELVKFSYVTKHTTDPLWQLSFLYVIYEIFWCLISVFAVCIIVVISVVG